MFNERVRISRHDQSEIQNEAVVMRDLTKVSHRETSVVASSCLWPRCHFCSAQMS